MSGIFHMRPISVGLDTPILQLFITSRKAGQGMQQIGKATFVHFFNWQGYLCLLFNWQGYLCLLF